MDGDGNPDLTLTSGQALAYELRRPVVSDQPALRDPVTLTVAAGNGSGDTDSITATTLVLNATRAAIGEIRAYLSNGGVVVEWKTLWEHGTVGFDLLRLNERSGRYHKVNKTLLPGLLHSRLGGTYRYIDRKARVGQVLTYKIRELEATGEKILYGPYVVIVDPSPPVEFDSLEQEVEQPMPGFERVARALSAVQQMRLGQKHAARKAEAARKSSRRGAVVKILVRDAGLYFLDGAVLAEKLDLSELRVSRLIRSNGLRLHQGGKRVATRAAQGGTVLYFYGEGIESQYARDNVYWLRVGKGLRMKARAGRSPAALTGQSFVDMVHAEGNQYALLHLFEDPDADYWMWDVLVMFSAAPEAVKTFVVPSPGALNEGADAQLRVRLQGSFETPAEVGHQAEVSINGEVLGDVSWPGLSAKEAVFAVPLSLLNDGDNTVEVKGFLPAGEGLDLFHVNDIELSYSRAYQADGGVLVGPGSGSCGVDGGRVLGRRHRGL